MTKRGKAPARSPSPARSAGKRTRAGAPVRSKKPSRARTGATALRPAVRKAGAKASRAVVTRPAASPPRSGPDPRRLLASFLEIVRKTSADLPSDVIRAIGEGRRREAPDSNALWAMSVIEENIDLARENSAPLCQDTGTILFYIRAPRGYDEPALQKAIEQAIVRATEKGYLRQNSVDSLTGRNSGNNLGPGSPVVHLHQWNRPGMDVRLILKGGGCENVGAQYSLPDTRLGAGRDLVGVEKCILDAIHQAQGKGCGPGILGVCIGGDRASGYAHSKEQFLRTLEDVNPVPELAALEGRVVEEANRLGIGPMGFGGSTTLLGCKVGVQNRLPASFFVSVSYMCWAYRRQGAVLNPDGSIGKWLY